MGRALPVVVAVVLAIYCLVQVVQSRADLVRILPRWLWVLVIALVPILGPGAWLAFGRPQQRRPPPRGRRARPLAPDDDPDFLRGLGPDRPRDKPRDKPRRDKPDDPR
jgi:cytochrome c-type biogenesis protein CcmH/NrfG